MTIIAKYWAWNTWAGNPRHRLALLVLSEFADRHNHVNMPFDAFTFYYPTFDKDVEPLLNELSEEGFITIAHISRRDIVVVLNVKDAEDEE